jgi:hypothetical protein
MTFKVALTWTTAFISIFNEVLFGVLKLRVPSVNFDKHRSYLCPGGGR